MSLRALVLTAGFGDGHNAAASATSTAWERAHGAGTAPVVDPLALAAPRRNRQLRRAYLHVINRHPRCWSAAYHWIDRSRLVPWCLRRLQAEQQVLHRLIAEQQPNAIISAYPVYGFLLQALRRRGARVPPPFTVVTDSISINALWWRAGGSGWFVPNSESAEILIRAGVTPGAVHVTGFPVAAAFATLARQTSVEDLARPGAVPAVLQMMHSGSRGAAAIARRLLAQPTWQVTITVGRDQALLAELQERANHRPAPTQILGWTDRIPHLLATHHVVISKAGGATTQEALAARCPMVVNQIVPGQEYGNYELLQRHGIGDLAETPETVVSVLERAFADHGRIWRQWRAAAAALARPDAATTIVEKVSQLILAPVPARLSAACGTGASA